MKKIICPRLDWDISLPNLPKTGDMLTGYFGKVKSYPKGAIKSGNATCHRRIVAKWLEDNLKVKVEELENETSGEKNDSNDKEL